MTIAAAKTDGSSRARPRPDPARVKAARVRLVEQELTAADWAARNGESATVVYHVLSGRRACVAGESRRVAIKLGIVDGCGHG